MILEITFWILLGALTVFYLFYFGLMRHSSKKPYNVQKENICPPVTVVIPTYNEEATIRRRLENIKALDYPRDKLEVIVVDSGSTDGTCGVVENFAKHNEDLAVQLLTQQKRLGKASALNYAFEKSGGDAVVISDADSLWDRNALKAVISNLADPRVGAAAGKQVLLNPNQSQATRSEMAYRTFYATLRAGESNMDSTPIFHGELSAYRRSLIEPISPDSMADDTELAIKIRKKGYRTIYDESAVFYEFAPPTMLARLKQKQRRGAGLIQQFLRNSRVMFNSRYGKYGRIIMPAEFFMHVLSPLMLTILAVTLVILTMRKPVYGFLLIATLLTVMLGVIPTKQCSNPFTVVGSFLSSQFCLLPAMISYVFKGPKPEWEKIEDVRKLWKSERTP